MINWGDKNGTGGNNDSRKEVAIRINRAGLAANGEQRYSVAIRFTEEGAKKASTSEYTIYGLDFDMNRMYFATSTRDKGYKLSAQSRSGKSKVFSFAVPDKNLWEKYVGDYDMHKDTAEGIYYIDLPKV